MSNTGFTEDFGVKRVEKEVHILLRHFVLRVPLDKLPLKIFLFVLTTSQVYHLSFFFLPDNEQPPPPAPLSS